MTPRHAIWSDADLELYLDSELDAARREALTADLRHDPALRERLACIGRIDALVVRTLMYPASPAVATRRGRWLLVGGPLALAAAAALTFVLWTLSPEAAGPGSRQQLASSGLHGTSGDSPRQAAVPYSAIRVVASLPVRARPPGAVEHHSTTLSDVEAPAVAAASPAGAADLDRLLSEGRVEEALTALAGSPREQKLDGYRRIGDLLRSASVAEQLLDRLAPADQLDVCATWAAEPTMRAIAFRRLERLAKSPELADGMAVVVKTLSSDAALRSWLVSYRLVESETR